MMIGGEGGEEESQSHSEGKVRREHISYGLEDVLPADTEENPQVTEADALGDDHHSQDQQQVEAEVSRKISEGVAVEAVHNGCAEERMESGSGVSAFLAKLSELSAP